MSTHCIKRFVEDNDHLLSYDSPPKPPPLPLSASPSQSPSHRKHDKHGILPVARRAIVGLTRLCLRTALVVATQLNSHGASPLHLAIVKGLSDEWLGRLLWAHRMAATVQDKDGYLTPLHVALRYDRTSIETIRLLVNAYPASLGVSSKSGCLPLHVAAKYSPSIEIICFLITSYPKSISAQTTHNQDTPLHLACRTDGAHSDGVVLTLLDWAPYCATARNSIDETPFSILFGLWDAFVSSSIGKSQIQAITCKSDMKGLLKRLWNKLRFLAKARYNTIVNIDLSHSTLVSDALLLHASVGASCPSSFIELVLRFYPCQVSKRDRTGRLPLAIAAATTFRCNNEGLWVIDKLLAAYPEAASITDGRGNYPLHLAIESNTTWDAGVKKIFNAFPDAIDEVHSLTGLPPFIAAAVEKRRRDHVAHVGDENFDTSKQCFNPRRGKVIPRNDSFDGYATTFHSLLSFNPALKCWEDNLDSDSEVSYDSNEDTDRNVSTEARPKCLRNGRDDSGVAQVDTIYHLMRSSPAAVRARRALGATAAGAAPRVLFS